MRGKEELETKVANWREKAKEHRIEKDRIRKKESEVRLSRSYWREKYYLLKEEHEQVLLQLEQSVFLSQTKVRNHTYCLEQIILALELRHEAGCSYRSCVAVMMIISKWLGIDWRIPSASTVFNWDLKLGYDWVNSKHTEAKDYVLILDESVTVDYEKVLLLTGVDLERYDCSRPLQMSDIFVLDIKVNRSWKSEAISEVIKGVERRNFSMPYACCDNGANLLKSLRDSGIVQIEDCSHALGNIMKRCYSKDDEFIELTGAVRKFKQRIGNSRYAEYAPPKWRSKARYLNLYPVCKWCHQMLKLVTKYSQMEKPPAVLSELLWINQYQVLIEKLYAEQKVIHQCQEVLKKECLSDLTKQKCYSIIEKSNIEQKIKEQIKQYLDKNQQRVKSFEKVICSSDIIESIFGKFKQRVANHPQGGLTVGCLTIANYNGNFDSFKVKMAMQNVKIRDLEKWREENLKESAFLKKKKLFKS